ncbi:hypothetical protein NQ317_016038 [Molorchus minor]|uniref:Uncharacterized protein n=1 Tax=Molorchus minor TaxID=1323400 RepID=A0ABQ9J4K4_9CUCU|nr:hypothetical protein NQ317_016038 [Molorchus minor]
MRLFNIAEGRSDLDGLAEGQDHYQDKFTASLNVFVTDTERKPSQPAPWQTDQTKRTIETMFTTQIEKEEVVDNFGMLSNCELASKAEGAYLGDYDLFKELIATIPEMIQAFPTLPELSRFCPNSSKGQNRRVWCLFIYLWVRGIDCDYSRNDPSPPDLSRTLRSLKPPSNLGGLNFGTEYSNVTPSTTPTSNSQTPNKVPPTTPQHSMQTTTTPKHQMKSPVVGGDYSRSHFDTFNKSQPAEPKPKTKGSDVFGDLLGSQGYSFTAKKENTPRTINAMRKEELAVYMDPEKLKILEWVSNFTLH